MPSVKRMSSVQIFPLNNYPNGVHGPFGPVDLADDVTSVLMSVARCTTPTPTIWPNESTVLDVLPEVSTDGGSTWTEAGRSVSPGGIYVSPRNNQEVAFSQSGGSLPVATGRKYRVTVTITGGPLRSSATIEVT